MNASTQLLLLGAFAAPALGQANAGPTLTGRLQFQTLSARIVVQDELTP